MFYIKGKTKIDIALFDPQTGTKRAVTAGEWRIVKLQNSGVVMTTVAQADFDALPLYKPFSVAG